MYKLWASFMQSSIAVKTRYLDFQARGAGIGLDFVFELHVLITSEPMTSSHVRNAIHHSSASSKNCVVKKEKISAWSLSKHVTA